MSSLDKPRKKYGEIVLDMAWLKQEPTNGHAN